MPNSSKLHHHRFASTKAAERHSSRALVASSPGHEAVDWPAALAELEMRQSQALVTLEQNHADRLAKLEERLAVAERASADLGGQIKEMR